MLLNKFRLLVTPVAGLVGHNKEVSITVTPGRGLVLPDRGKAGYGLTPARGLVVCDYTREMLKPVAGLVRHDQISRQVTPVVGLVVHNLYWRTPKQTNVTGG